MWEAFSQEAGYSSSRPQYIQHKQAYSKSVSKVLPFSLHLSSPPTPTAIPPEFSPGGRLQDQVAFRGDSLHLTCSARSAPPSNYTWTKDSLPVVSSPALDLSNGQLVIKNVSSEFVGNYTCLAKATLPENGTVIGEVSSSGEVRVVEPTAFTSTAEPLVYRQVKDNPRPIVLPCAVEGDGVAVFDITWQRNGAPLSPGSSGPSLSRPSPRALTLTFETWSPSDSGVYECRVSTSLMGFSTSVPRVTSSTTNLTIASESPSRRWRVGGWDVW